MFLPRYLLTSSRYQNVLECRALYINFLSRHEGEDWRFSSDPGVHTLYLYLYLYLVLYSRQINEGR